MNGKSSPAASRAKASADRRRGRRRAWSSASRRSATAPASSPTPWTNSASRWRDRRLGAQADHARHASWSGRRSPSATSCSASIRSRRARNHVNKMAEFEATTSRRRRRAGDRGRANISNMGGISAQTGQRQGELGAIVQGGIRDVRALARGRLSDLGERHHAGHRQVADRGRRDQRRRSRSAACRSIRATWSSPTTPASCSSRATASSRAGALREKEEGRGHPHRLDQSRRAGADFLQQGIEAAVRPPLE